MGVGAALGAIVLVLAGWFLAAWHKKRHAAKTDEDFMTTYLEVRQGRTSRAGLGGGAISPSAGAKHRPLADFIPDKDSKEKWDPSDTFYKPGGGAGGSSGEVTLAMPSTATVSVRSQASVQDFMGGVNPSTPDRASFELLPKSARKL